MRDPARGARRDPAARRRPDGARSGAREARALFAAAARKSFPPLRSVCGIRRRGAARTGPGRVTSTGSCGGASRGRSLYKLFAAAARNLLSPPQLKFFFPRPQLISYSAAHKRLVPGPRQTRPAPGAGSGGALSGAFLVSVASRVRIARPHHTRKLSQESFSCDRRASPAPSQESVSCEKDASLLPEHRPFPLCPPAE